MKVRENDAYGNPVVHRWNLNSMQKSQREKHLFQMTTEILHLQGKNQGNSGRAKKNVTSSFILYTKGKKQASSRNNILVIDTSIIFKYSTY